MRQLLLSVLFFIALASGAYAEVTLTFYSHHFVALMDWASHFPMPMSS